MHPIVIIIMQRILRYGDKNFLWRRSKTVYSLIKSPVHCRLCETLKEFLS